MIAGKTLSWQTNSVLTVVRCRTRREYRLINSVSFSLASSLRTAEPLRITTSRRSQRFISCYVCAGATISWSTGQEHRDILSASLKQTMSGIWRGVCVKPQVRSFSLSTHDLHTTCTNCRVSSVVGLCSSRYNNTIMSDAVSAWLLLVRRYRSRNDVQYKNAQD